MVTIVGKDDTKKLKATCHYCGSMLEFFEKDLIVKIESDYTGSKDYVKYVLCPECGNHVYKHS